MSRSFLVEVILGWDWVDGEEREQVVSKGAGGRSVGMAGTLGNEG